MGLESAASSVVCRGTPQQASNSLQGSRRRFRALQTARYQQFSSRSHDVPPNLDGGVVQQSHQFVPSICALLTVPLIRFAGLFAQHVSVGVQPLLYAATVSAEEAEAVLPMKPLRGCYVQRAQGADVERNDYTGPNGLGGMKGPAIKARLVHRTTGCVRALLISDSLLRPPLTTCAFLHNRRSQAETTKYAKDAATAEALWKLSVAVTKSADYLS